MDLISFIKSFGSPFKKLIKIVVVSFSVWMIWRRMNYSRFQQEINTHFSIDFIKNYIRMSCNSSNKSMYNDIFGFSILKFFGIIKDCLISVLGLEKSQSLPKFYGVFYLLAGLKSTLMVLLEVILILLFVLGSLEGGFCWLFFFPWDIIFLICRVYVSYHCY